jgi:hypothetical protein
VNQSIRPPSLASSAAAGKDPFAPSECPSCGGERGYLVLSGVEGYFIAAVCSVCGKGERESRFYLGYERAEAALHARSFVRGEF